MISKLTAEFDSIDSAETAARSIKHSISDIARISIKTKNSFALSNSTPRSSFVTGGFNGNSVSVYYPYTYGQNVSDTNFYSNPLSLGENFETGHEAEIEVICNSTVANEVSRTLVGLGGLHIRKS